MFAKNLQHHGTIASIPDNNADICPLKSADGVLIFLCEMLPAPIHHGDQENYRRQAPMVGDHLVLRIISPPATRKSQRIWL